MPTLETAAGQKIDVDPADINVKFRAAMDDDGPDNQAPPKRPAKPADTADAPKARRGRPPKTKTEKARTEDTPVKDDYTADTQAFIGGVWTGLAAIPYTQPYALILHSNSDALVGALAEGARHSATIRAFVDSGKSSWMLTLAGVSLSMGMQAYQMARDPQMQEQARAVTVGHLKDALGAQGLDVPAAA